MTHQTGQTEFQENFWKMINCLVWKFTMLNWSILKLILLKLSVETLLLNLKNEIRLVYTEGNVCKDTNIMSCKTKL